MDLIEDHQGEDFADPRHRAEPIQRVAIVSLRCAQDEELEFSQYLVVEGQQVEIDLDALVDTRVTESVHHAASVAGVGDPLLDIWQIVLAVGILDVG